SLMTALRRDHSALRYGDYMTLRADEQVYAYLRSDFNGRLLTLIYRDKAPGRIKIALPPEFGAASLECLNADPVVRQHAAEANVFTVETEPYSGYVFKLVKREP
ncbi:MAG: hypothetical protein JXR21_05795, partial [Candidatus Marinimicrobia bacterium]|nr:hypothetical protein [Candidatus Neomarinimicrobiota bacterium]